MNLALIVVIGLSVALGLILVLTTVVSAWRRKEGLPADMLHGDPPAYGSPHGEYLGTFSEGFHKRFDLMEFLKPGVGQLGVDEQGVKFLVDGLLQPIFLPWARIDRVHTESLPDEKPFSGRKGLIVHWTLDHHILKSVFVAKVDLEELADTAQRALTGTREGL